MIRACLYPLSLAIVLAIVAAFPAPASAETYHTCKGYIDSVPATISQQGVWCLRQDLSTGIASGSAITIAANNVTIDCNDFKLGGLAAGVGTETIGIFANGRSNAAVRGCNVRGFWFGVYLLGGGGHRVERSSFDSNTYLGIYVGAPGSMIRGNQVIDTGGSTGSSLAFGIYAELGVDVIDNTVNGVAPSGSNASAYGIFTVTNGGASIVSNRIRGLAPTGTGISYGISNVFSGRLVVRDNDVQGTGAASGVGVVCASNQATARDNVIAGFATGVTSCLSSGNTVNAN